MKYTPYYPGGSPGNWQDNPPSISTPIVAASLNNMEAGIQNAVGLNPSGDTSGATDFTAIQTIMNAGAAEIRLGPGTFYSTVLSPKSGCRITAQSYLATTLSAVAGQALFNMDNGAQLDNFELDHVTCQAVAGQPIFSGMYVTRSSVHDCWLNAASGSASSSIWLSNSGTGYMAECRFFHNREQVYGTSRTVPAWLLQSTNATTLYQVNDNLWRSNVCFNNDHDTAQYFYELSFSSTGFATATNNANTFEDIAFEFPTGGMIWLDSCSYCTINRCTNEDLAALTVGNPLIQVTKNANGGGSVGNKIRSYSRRSGSAAMTDIQLASTCSNTVIDAPYQAGGGTALTINYGSSSAVTATGVPAAAVQSGYAGTGAVTAASKATAPASPAAITSTAQLMAGLGANSSWTYTPQNTGIVLVTITGEYLSTSAGATVTIGARYGTGSAPANAGALAGTSFVGNPVLANPSASNPAPFSFTARLGSLTAGTAYWLDLALAASAGAATITNCVIQLQEAAL